MSEYALLVNNEFQEIRHYLEQPENIPHKNIEWLPVDYRAAEAESTTREDNVWVVYFVPVRRKIEKSVILDRLTDDQLAAALSLMSVRQKEQWRMPGHPEVYVDDPEVVALLTAIGANAAEVLA